MPDNLAQALPRVHLLTRRELEVFFLLRAGMSNNDVARDLHVTERTAKAHVAQIVDKLALSRLQACLLAWIHFAQD